MDGNDQLAWDFGVFWSTSMQKLHLLVGLSEWCKVAAKTVKEPFLRYNETLLSSMPNSDDENLRQYLEMEAIIEHVSSLYLADAAIVVFAHSVLDELINGALALSMKLDISVWQERILKWSKERKRYSLLDVQAKTFNDLLEEESIPYLNHLKRCSLPNRTAVLLATLKPRPS
jgi:hypothetical protein